MNGILSGRTCLAGLALVALPFAAVGQPAAPPSPVAVEPVVSSIVTATVPVTGTVHSRNDLNVTLGVDGRIEFVAEPGTRVAAGEIIASIDTTPQQLRIEEQRALVRRARAQLKFLDSQLERETNLIGTNSTSRNQLEQTQSNRDVAASDLNIAELRIRQLQDEMARGVVRAPFDGIVVERLSRAGEDVSRGTVVARFTDTENLEIRVFAPLRYAGRVAPGDELTIFGFESERAGVVRTVVPSADVRSQTFELRIDPASGQQAWAIGQLVSVAIPIRAGQMSLVVPRDALILRQEGTFVFVVDEDQTARRVQVTTGDSAGQSVAVTGALTEGDRVVVRGAETLSDGRTVSIITAGS